MKNLIFMAILLSSANLAYGQNFADNALLFGRTSLGGSARIQSIGGAQVALGGDYSSSLSNPAGVAMYNRSEITLTPAFNFVNSTSAYQGETTDDSKFGFNIPGLSFVFHHDTERESGFLGGSVAITMSRINDLNSVFHYQGNNSNSSLIDYFIYDASTYGLIPENMFPGGPDYNHITGLAYNNYLFQDYID